MHPLEYFIRQSPPCPSIPKFMNVDEFQVSHPWILEKKHQKSNLKFLSLHCLLHIVFEFLLEQNVNRPIYLFPFDLMNPKPVMTSLLTRSPIKYFFTIMSRNHRTIDGYYKFCLVHIIFSRTNKKDHKFLWERGSRIEKYSSSFASNSSWLTGILKMSDEIRVRYRKK